MGLMSRLNEAEADLLISLYVVGSLDMPAIGRYADLDPQDAETLVQGLVRRKLVARREDRRVEITDDGGRLADKVRLQRVADYERNH